MSDLHGLARGLIVTGALIITAGVLVMAAQKLPWLGRLPLDIRIERPGFSFYFPIGTCILVSVVMSLAMWLMGKFRQ